MPVMSKTEKAYVLMKAKRDYDAHSKLLQASLALIGHMQPTPRGGYRTDSLAPLLRNLVAALDACGYRTQYAREGDQTT